MRFQNVLERSPQIHYIPDFDPKPETPWYGSKALWYEGAPYQSQKTKVFAHIGFPEEAKTRKVPAVVLVHGGGGHAYPEWIRLWNEKGFAAIAMDTTGFFPSKQWKGLVGTEDWTGNKGLYVHQLYDDLAEPGYAVGPDNSEMKDYAEPLEEQWMYHAVSAVILAHNILRNDERVDPSKTGIVGISWGGVIASLTIGYDNRYCFAVPIYGSGYIDAPPAPPRIPDWFRQPEVKANWSAADRFDRIHFPVLWQCWRREGAFSIGGNSLSYQATKNANAFFSIRPDMDHSHIHGWGAPESYRFAQKTVSGKLPFPQIKNEPADFAPFICPISVPEDFTQLQVQLVCSETPLHYGADGKPANAWKSQPVTLCDGVLTGQAPETACCYYLELTGKANGIDYVTSTALVHRK